MGVGAGAGDAGIEGIGSDGLGCRAAVEPPGGIDDLGSDDSFGWGGGREAGEQRFAEFVVKKMVFGGEVVRAREEAEFCGVAGGGGFAFGRARAGGQDGVAAIGSGLGG